MSNYAQDVFSPPIITPMLEHQRRIASEVQLLIAMFNLASDEVRQRFVDWLEEPQEEEI